jgi:hypothetical protein
MKTVEADPNYLQPTWRNIAIAAFCLFFMGASFIDNLNNSTLKTATSLYTSNVLIPLGMWQRWDMFAAGEATFVVRTKRTYADKTSDYQYSVLGNQHAPWYRSVHTNFDFSLAVQASPTYAGYVLAYECKRPYNGKTPISMSLESARLTVPTLSKIPVDPNPSQVTPNYATLRTVQCN